MTMTTRKLGGASGLRRFRGAGSRSPRRS